MRIVIATLLVVALAGAAAPPANATTERQVLRALKYQPNGDRYPVVGCEVFVVLNTPQEVALYRDAGDPVATDTRRRVGVKTENRRCVRIFSSRLRRVFG